MQLHNLAPKTKFRKGRRIGRGGKRGTFSGRGTKGQKSRAGAKIRPAERDILKKIPKLRGFKFKSFKSRPAVVNFIRLQKEFDEGETISPDTLLKRKVISKIKGRMPRVKILGKGDLKKKFIFKDVIFSKSAKTHVK